MSQYAQYPSLRDRVVFITGGGGGIGAEMVRQFVVQGAKVGFIDINEEAGAGVTEAAADLGAHRPLFVAGDLRDIDALRDAIGQTADKFGTIGVLVNNAAHDERHDWEDITPEYWDDRMAVNLRHQFFAIQAVAPGMKKAGGGSIINFGSVSWMLKMPEMPAYTAAKAAVQGLTRTMAKALGPFDIRVNCLVPGWILTERQLDLWFKPEDEEMLFSNQCLHKKLYPDHVARMVLFLAADDSDGCTAHNYLVDGGWAGQ
ncbi:MAG: SDR family NAD(P)-dependent oxidoreductase [Alphaproteobacteria bacterium]